MIPAAGLIETYFIGMGGGISSAIARALGSSRGADANALVLHAVLIPLAFGLTFTLAIFGGGRWLSECSSFPGGGQ